MSALSASIQYPSTTPARLHPRGPGDGWWLPWAALAACALASLSGCASTIAHGVNTGRQSTYPGTRLSGEVIKRAGKSPVLGVAALVDLPLTFVADTVLLPLDLVLYRRDL